MRISDWSSDVCSSDLPDQHGTGAAACPEEWRGRAIRIQPAGGGRPYPRRQFRPAHAARRHHRCERQDDREGGFVSDMCQCAGCAAMHQGLGAAALPAGWDALLLPGAGWAFWCGGCVAAGLRSEEHTCELQSLMRISYAVFCSKKKKTKVYTEHKIHIYVVEMNIVR